MKVRIKIPQEAAGNKDREQTFIDDVMLWGMETGMDIDHYCIWRDPESTWNKPVRWAVFTIESEYSFMFSLKWGALLHKKQQQMEE